MDNYGDPGFRYFQAASRVWGLMALRLSYSHVLPFDPPLQADALEGYLAALSPSSARDGEDVEKEGDGARASGTVPAKSAVALSEIDLAPLQEAVAAFRVAADKVGAWAARYDSGDGSGSNGGGGRGDSEGVSTAAAEAARAVALRGAGAGAVARDADPRKVGNTGRGGGGKGGALPRGQMSAVADRLQQESLNDRLAMTERRFLVDEGLPGRQWFRHVLQAPGLYLG